MLFGERKLRKKLRTLAPNIAKKHLRKSMRQALKPMHKDAKAKAPKDTGKLKKGIRILAGGRSTIKIRYSILSYNPEGMYYGGSVEYGTKELPPQPFMKPAFKKHRKKVIKEVLSNTLKAFEIEARK